MKRVACIHTVYSVISDFTDQLRAALEEDVKIHTLYDDFLATDPADTGRFSAVNHERLRLDMKAQALTGADMIVVSCSTLSPSVRLLRPEFNVPVVAIDDAMVREAVQKGGRIGLLATANSTVKPSHSALLAAAKAVGRDVDIEIICDEDAIRALKSGDKAKHDRMVLDMARQFEGRDVIVLAQASIAHMERAVEEATGIPTLSSPSRCVAEIKGILEAMA